MTADLLDDLTDTSGHRLAPDHVVWTVDGDLVWSHRCGVGRPYRAVYVGPPRSGHTIDAGGPNDLPHLTIGGSLICRDCGRHGFIRAGEWVAA